MHGTRVRSADPNRASSSPCGIRSPGLGPAGRHDHRRGRRRVAGTRWRQSARGWPPDPGGRGLRQREHLHLVASRPGRRSRGPVAEFPAADASGLAAAGVQRPTVACSAHVARPTATRSRCFRLSRAVLVTRGPERERAVRRHLGAYGAGRQRSGSRHHHRPGHSAVGPHRRCRSRPLPAAAPGRRRSSQDHRPERDAIASPKISYPVGGPAYVTFSRTTKAVSKPLVRYTGLSRIRMHRREPFTLRGQGRPPDHRLPDQPARRAPPWPTVLVIHDGPWSRDEAHMDPWAQYLASAGLLLRPGELPRAHADSARNSATRATASGRWPCRTTSSTRC